MSAVKRLTFADAISIGGDGVIHSELTEELEALAKRVSETKRPGTLDIKIKVFPKISKAGEQIEISVATKASFPKEDLPTGRFFVTTDGCLSRDAPNQTRMSLLKEDTGGEG